MKPEYTKIRQIYAWAGFLAIPCALLLAAYVALGAKEVECTVPELNTPYKPISDVLERPIPVILATSTEIARVIEKKVELDYVNESEIKSKFFAQVTGYNTVESQTDSTPCIAASGEYVCDRDDTLACPSAYAFGTKFLIYGKIYECVDRTHAAIDGVFDINCNKDFSCPNSVTSYAEINLLY